MKESGDNLTVNQGLYGLPLRYVLFKLVKVLLCRSLYSETLSSSTTLVKRSFENSSNNRTGIELLEIMNVIDHGLIRNPSTTSTQL